MKKRSHSVKNFPSGIAGFNILDTIGNGITIQDAGYTILYQNEAHKMMFGSHVGEPCHKAHVCSEKACERCPLTRVFSTGEVCRRELTMQTEKGIFFLSSTSSPVKNKRGDIIAVIQIVRDITEQKCEEERLREREEKYRTVFSNAMDAICLIDPGTLKIVDCNQKATELSGYTPKTLIGMNIRDLHPKEEQDVVARIFEKTSAMGSLSGIYGVNQSRFDGIGIPVELNLTSVRIYGKDYIIYSARDISRQKQEQERLIHDIAGIKTIEQSLRDSEERFRKIFMLSPLGIAVADPEGKLMEANTAFRDMLGYTQDELPGDFMDITHQGDIKENMRLFHEMVEGNREHYEAEIRYYRKNGTIMWANISVAPIKDSRGKLKYNVSFIEDITAKKLTGKKLQVAPPFSEDNKTERRVYARYTSAEKCKASLGSSDLVRIKDISCGGTCLKTSRKIRVNSIMTVKIFPSINGEIMLKASVIWSFRIQKRFYETGFKFIEAGDNLKKSIETFILKHPEKKTP